MNTIMRGAILTLSVLLLGLVPARALAAEAQPHKVAIVGLSGEVDEYAFANLQRQFHDAKAAGADTIILDINTYGGQVTAAMDISRFIKGQTDLHTIAFVDDKAISAGSMIAVACDEIVMKPSGVLGDCAPIQVGPEGVEPVPPTERAKFDSPVLADFEDSARRNGYSTDVVDAFVVVNTPLYLAQWPTETRPNPPQAVNKAHYDALLKQGYVPYMDFYGHAVAEPYMPADRLLTVDPAQAKMLGLSRGTATSAEALASDRGYTIVADLSPGFADAMVRLLVTPEARFLTLVVFMLALYISLHAPGHGAAEAVAIVALAMLVGAPLLAGYAQWWEVGMILVGLGLCAFELLVFPGHGVSLVVGSVMVLFGLVATFVGRVPAGSTWHAVAPGLQTGLIVVIGATVVSMVLASYLRRFLPKIPYFKGLILTTVSGGSATAAADDLPTRASNDTWPFVGTVGLSVTDLRPGGTVRFPFGADTRQAAVVSAGGYVLAGQRVVVQEARGNHVVVRPLE